MTICLCVHLCVFVYRFYVCVYAYQERARTRTITGQRVAKEQERDKGETVERVREKQMQPQQKTRPRHSNTTNNKDIQQSQTGGEKTWAWRLMSDVSLSFVCTQTYLSSLCVVDLWSECSFVFQYPQEHKAHVLSTTAVHTSSVPEPFEH